MKSRFRYTLFFSLAILGFSRAIAQQPLQDTVLLALQDEIKRSMDALQAPGHDKPFFILYGMQDQKIFSVSAILGAVVESRYYPVRLKSTTRVLVGDYTLNDESLEDDLYSNSTPIEIDLPVENDYAGIRRAYWSTTDNVYREAARHHKKHKETLKEMGKPLADIPHREFAKSEPVTLVKTQPDIKLDQREWEERAKRLSAIFLKYPMIETSGVYINQSRGHQYLASTEGTMAKLPMGVASFTVMAQMKTEDGVLAFEQLTKNARTIDQLPSEQELAAEIEKMVTGLIEGIKRNELEEEYTGPVLLAGAAIPTVFAASLFGGREALIANDNIPKLEGYRYNTEQSMDAKIGKLVFGDGLTVKAKPRLRTFEGTELLGSFEMDNEGIVPAEETLLVENGILKALMNNRTITHKSQTANGFFNGPGVVEVQLKQKMSEAQLKARLLQKAREQGLEFALIIRDVSLQTGLAKIYKVNVADGKEEHVKDGFLGAVGVRVLKRISGASAKYVANNIGSPFANGAIGAGSYVSFITPESVLIDELEVKPYRMPYLQQEAQFVTNPLKK